MYNPSISASVITDELIKRMSEKDIDLYNDYWFPIITYALIENNHKLHSDGKLIGLGNTFVTLDDHIIRQSDVYKSPSVSQYELVGYIKTSNDDTLYVVRYTSDAYDAENGSMMEIEIEDLLSEYVCISGTETALPRLSNNIEFESNGHSWVADVDAYNVVNGYSLYNGIGDLSVYKSNNKISLHYYISGLSSINSSCTVTYDSIVDDIFDLTFKHLVSFDTTAMTYGVLKINDSVSTDHIL